ncbi:MAG: M20/M25/M40 family metallo-hydrolase [Gemmatimonadota bacterium]|jgi:glutamate carboxypeptidase
MKYRTLPTTVATVTMVVTLSGAIAAQELSPVEQAIVTHVESHAAGAETLLERIVNMNTGTMNHVGIREVGSILRQEFDALGFSTRWIEMPDSVNRAGHLFAERIGTRGRRLLLIGHLDTVFEPGDPFQELTREESTATGPGVVDMKGGVVAMVYALAALDAAGALDGATIRIALIGDEEFAGLPLELSRGDLVAAAQESDVAFGFEGGETGRAVVARRGSSAWTLEVSGQQGHSSLIFGDRFGSGAIFEAARILHRFHDEVRGPEYLTFNPGIILGGTEVDYNSTDNRGTSFGKTNVIAQRVVVDGGLRFISEEQKEAAREQMRAIVADHLPGTSAEVFFKDKYPAMPPTAGNQALLALLDQVSRELGQGPVEAFDPAERGAADISFVAPYVDGLDGLGPFGSGAHTPNEQLDLVSLPAVTKRAALMIYRLTRE